MLDKDRDFILECACGCDNQLIIDLDVLETGASLPKGTYDYIKNNSHKSVIIKTGNSRYSLTSDYIDEEGIWLYTAEGSGISYILIKSNDTIEIEFEK